MNLNIGDRVRLTIHDPAPYSVGEKINGLVVTIINIIHCATPGLPDDYEYPVVVKTDNGFRCAVERSECETL